MSDFRILVSPRGARESRARDWYRYLIEACGEMDEEGAVRRQVDRCMRKDMDRSNSHSACTSPGFSLDWNSFTFPKHDASITLEHCVALSIKALAP